ncbi:MAG: hypothetical protein U0974_03105 [Gemmatimonadales bacterium]|nr:hypothetical protein [Gemmatimonadales bacterium]MDZ4388702.1 hypothetical protein [Gemmatimonadales bacterium]
MSSGYRISLPRTGMFLLAMAVSMIPTDGLPGQSPPQLLTATETLRIDGEDHQFSAINGVLVAPSGRIAVLQPQDHQVRFFSGEGRSLGSFGRRGAGPGEFQSLLSVAGWLGDTLWVNDSHLRRTTFIGPDRRVQRTLGWPRGLLRAGEVGGIQPRGLVVPWGFLSANTIITPHASSIHDVMVDGKPRSVSNGIFQVDTIGHALALVAERASEESTECIKRWNEGQASGSITAPFCGVEQFDVSPDGRWIVILRPLAPTGTTVASRLVVVDAHGDTVIARRLNAPAERPSAQQRDSVAQSMRVLANGGLGRTMPAAAVRAIATIEVPTQFPMVDGVLVGSDRTVWLQRPAAGSSRAWWIVSADGGAVYRTVIPTTVALHVVSKEAVWGIDTNAEGVESIVRYTIRGWQ